MKRKMEFMHPTCTCMRNETALHDRKLNICHFVKCGYVDHTQNERCNIPSTFGAAPYNKTRKIDSPGPKDRDHGHKRKDYSFIQDVFMRMNAFSLPILCIVSSLHVLWYA